MSLSLEKVKEVREQWEIFLQDEATKRIIAAYFFFDLLTPETLNREKVENLKNTNFVTGTDQVSKLLDSLILLSNETSPSYALDLLKQLVALP